MRANSMITFNNMHEHTEQAVFDVCALHLLTQNKRSVDVSDNCMYRSPCGLKCAIGVIISDEEYAEDMEGNPIATLLFRRDLEDHKYESLLRDIQRVHDMNADVSVWLERLIHLAKRHGLSDNLVVNFKRSK